MTPWEKALSAAGDAIDNMVDQRVLSTARYVEAVIASLKASGYVVVPEEATQAMLEKAGDAFMDGVTGHIPGDLENVNTPFKRFYRAMITTAQKEQGNV